MLCYNTKKLLHHGVVTFKILNALIQGGVGTFKILNVLIQGLGKKLEPIVKMEVAVPSKYMGDVTGDVSGRRGRVIGMDSVGDLQVVRAEVPLAEVQEYSSYLRSVTGGEGSYAMEFLRYDVLPSHMTQAVAASFKDDKEEE